MISADHQNKADIAASKAREWMDTQGVTMLFGGTNSGTALAIAKVAEEKKRVYFNNGAGSSALTNEQCTPTPCTMPTTPWRWPKARALRLWTGRQELVLPDG